MRLVVSSGDDDVLVPLMRSICDQTGWEVSDYLTGFSSLQRHVSPAEAFPGCVVHPPQDSSRGMLPASESGTRLPEIDLQVLQKMSPYEHMFMCLLDIYDPDGRSFTGWERRDAYYALLRFGLHIINRKPDLYIAGSVPNALHDYMVYCLCRAYGIPTVVYCLLPSIKLVIPFPSLEEGNHVLRRNYREALKQSPVPAAELDEAFESYYSRTRADHETATPWYLAIRDYSLFRKQTFFGLFLNPFDPDNYARSALRKAKYFARLLLSRSFYEEEMRTPQADFFKDPKKTLAESLTNRHETARVFEKSRKVKRRLLAQYEKLQIADVRLDRPYVYVPLHVQPEATTFPLGGYYLDQILMIRLLSESLPEGWVIYVKEHRITFDPGLRGDFGRSDSYYQQISGIPGAFLIPMDTSSFELMDKAAAVGNVTGTAGFEALLRGTPAIVFGNAWYMECDGAFDGRTREGCRQAFAEIVAGRRPDAMKVRLFMRELRKIGVRANREYENPQTDITPEENVRRLSEHLLRELPKMYPEIMVPR
jgi:hypothetical protein